MYTTIPWGYSSGKPTVLIKYVTWFSHYGGGH